MSKKKKDKVKSKKAGKKSLDKKAVKKAHKPSPKENAAKTSKPKKANKAKPVVKKSSVKTAKPAKKAPVKASKPKASVKVLSKNIKPKKVIVKKAAVKKVISKKVEKKVLKKTAPKPVKPSKLINKPSAKPVNKSVPAAAITKKALVKPVASMGSATKKEQPISTATTIKRQEALPLKKVEELPSKKQIAERKSNDVLAISNTIPVKEKNELPLSKIASISSSITNPIKKTDSYAVKPEKEPNGKFELEFVVHSSAEMLYEFLSTPSGLSEWFCDDLNIRNGIYTFIWDDQLQQARLLKTVDLQLVRFQWVDKTDGSYFEFKIQRDDLTNDISLIITDFAESAGDRESSKLLWHSQIEKLMHVIGSIF